MTFSPPQVAFLFQDALVSHIATAIEQLLSNANATHHIPTARVAPTAIAYAGQDGRGGTQGGGGGGKRGGGGGGPAGGPRPPAYGCRPPGPHGSGQWGPGPGGGPPGAAYATPPVPL